MRAATGGATRDGQSDEHLITAALALATSTGSALQPMEVSEDRANLDEEELVRTSLERAGGTNGTNGTNGTSGTSGTSGRAIGVSRGRIRIDPRAEHEAEETLTEPRLQPTCPMCRTAFELYLCGQFMRETFGPCGHNCGHGAAPPHCRMCHPLTYASLEIHRRGLTTSHRRPTTNAGDAYILWMEWAPRWQVPRGHSCRPMWSTRIVNYSAPVWFGIMHKIGSIVTNPLMLTQDSLMLTRDSLVGLTV